MKTYLQTIIITAGVFSLLLGCASTSKLEKQMLSDNDSMRVEALYKFDNKLPVDKQLEIIRSLINRAKYGKPKESLLAIECLAHSSYSLELSGHIIRGVQSKHSLKIDKLVKLTHTVDGLSIHNYVEALEKGSPKAKIYCIDVIGLSRPIYVDAVELLVEILNKKWDNPYSKEDIQYSQWEDPSYHAYQALQSIKTMQALEATAKFEAVYKKQ